MISKIINRIKRALRPVTGGNDKQTVNQPIRMSQREMIKTLQSIPFWEDKIGLYKRYVYTESHGVWLDRTVQNITDNSTDALLQSALALRKVNYGCGGNLIEGWLNIDLYQSDALNYRYVNLLEKHPLPDNSVKYGFQEDMLEHLNQAESIFFLGEIFRTLEPGGVIRLSFPGLEGVLSRHYSPMSETRLREGEFEAYSFWDHVHFYSKGELELVANHIGFSQIEFVQYGKSRIPDLCLLDTRENQIGLNTYVELTK